MATTATNWFYNQSGVTLSYAQASGSKTHDEMDALPRTSWASGSNFSVTASSSGPTAQNVAVYPSAGYCLALTESHPNGNTFTSLQIEPWYHYLWYNGGGNSSYYFQTGTSLASFFVEVSGITTSCNVVVVRGTQDEVNYDKFYVDDQGVVSLQLSAKDPTFNFPDSPSESYASGRMEWTCSYSRDNVTHTASLTFSNPHISRTTSTTFPNVATACALYAVSLPLTKNVTRYNLSDTQQNAGTYAISVAAVIDGVDTISSSAGDWVVLQQGYPLDITWNVEGTYGFESAGVDVVYQAGSTETVAYDEQTTGNVTSVTNIWADGMWVRSYSYTINGALESLPYTLSSATAVSVDIVTSCFLPGTQITLADGTKKAVEDLTYDDELKVWNFDEGRFDTANILWLTKPGLKQNHYYRLTLSDGTVLETTGLRSNHKFYNADDCYFQGVAYAEIGTRVFTENGIATIINKEYIEDDIEYVNVITDQHFNCFANGVLTSDRYSNMYPISEDMKYIKDERPVRPYSEFEARGIKKYWYDGFRLYENTDSLDSIVTYIGKCEAQMRSRENEINGNN